MTQGAFAQYAPAADDAWVSDAWARMQGKVSPSKAKQLKPHEVQAQQHLADDLMVLAWAVYPWRHAYPAASRRLKERELRQMREDSGQLFAWLWWHTSLQVPEQPPIHLAA